MPLLVCLPIALRHVVVTSASNKYEPKGKKILWSAGGSGCPIFTSATHIVNIDVPRCKRQTSTTAKHIERVSRPFEDTRKTEWGWD